MTELRKQQRAEIWGSDLDRYVLRHPVIVIDDVVVDVEAFFQTRSGCDLCGQCCTWGATLDRATAERLRPHLQEIGERYIPADRRDKLGWFFAREWDLDHTNITDVEEGRKGCAFLYKKGDAYLCAIYSWALDTGREPFDYWPYECMMYPVAILPYKGLLHEGKSFLTLRMAQTWNIVDVYGSRQQGSHLRSVINDLQAATARRLQRFGFGARPAEAPPVDCYFKASSTDKPLAYVYYARQVQWCFGEDFYDKMCAAAKEHIPRPD